MISYPRYSSKGKLKIIRRKERKSKENKFRDSNMKTFEIEYLISNNQNKIFIQISLVIFIEINILINMTNNIYSLLYDKFCKIEIEITVKLIIFKYKWLIKFFYRESIDVFKKIYVIPFNKIITDNISRH